MEKAINNAAEAIPSALSARQRVKTFQSVDRYKVDDHGKWELVESGIPVEEMCNQWCDENNMNPVEANTTTLESRTADEHVVLFLLTAIVIDRAEQMRQERTLRDTLQSLAVERVPMNTTLPPEIRPNYNSAFPASKHDLGDAIKAKAQRG